MHGSPRDRYVPVVGVAYGAQSGVLAACLVCRLCWEHGAQQASWRGSAWAGGEGGVLHDGVAKEERCNAKHGGRPKRNDATLSTADNGMYNLSRR